MLYKRFLALLLALFLSFSVSGVFAADEEDIFVGDIVFYASENEKTKEVSDLGEASALSACVKVANRGEKAQEITMFIAYYGNDGRLLNLSSDKKTVESGAEEEFFAGFSFERYVEIGTKAKAFVFGKGQLPLSAEKIVKNATVMKSFYVSSSGDDDNQGTMDAPFLTIERAKEEVRKHNGDMSGDINVYLRAGIYRQSETLEFTKEDSGTNGYYVNYMSYPGEEASVTGSKKIDNFKKEGALWVAEVDGINYAPQLFVNDKKAKRAESEVYYNVKDFFDVVGNEYQNDGIIAEEKDFSQYGNQGDIQLHFARGWKSFLLNVEKIEKSGNESRFVMSQPSFYNAEDEDACGFYNINAGHNFKIENAFEELDTEGEFYYNRKTKRLYYMPRAGENIETAEVELAAIEKLIDLKGDSSLEKVRNISFKNLTFAHSIWERASRVGHIGDQAQDMTPDPSDIPVNPGYTLVPSNISLDRAEKINFTGCTIKDMGAVGIGLYQGVSDCDFTGNVFCDLGDSAMTIGTQDQAYTDDVYSGRNLAGGKAATASGYSHKNYMPEKALDVNKKTGWSAGGKTPFWWQVDLGEAIEIDRIEIDDRQDGGEQVGIRKNIEIWGSNDEEFNNYEVLYSLKGSNEYPNDEAVVFNIENSGEFRFVRIIKTNAEHLYLAEVRIINESMEYSPVNEICKNNTINNNYITRVGNTNYGAPGIQAYFVEGIDISHNYVYDVPYSGICVGWGWSNFPDSVTCRENKINYNKIEKTLQTNYDAGGIYILGNQPNSEIKGNYIVDSPNANGGIYLDNGSSHYTIEDNVIEDVPFSLVAGMYTQNNTWKNNYSDTLTVDWMLNLSGSCSFEEPILFAPNKHPLEAKEIIENAGLEGIYEDIISKTNDLYKERDVYNNVIKDVGNVHLSDSFILSAYLENYVDSVKAWMPLCEGDYPQSAVLKLEKALEDAEKVIAESEKKIKAKEDIDRVSVTEARKTIKECVDNLEYSNYEGLSSQSLEMNVAQYKKVTGDGTEHASYPLKNINDGNRQTMTTLGDNTIKGFTIDLEKMYNIKRIELISRQDGANDIQSRQYFEIWAAEKEDFSDGVKLGGFKTQNAELFPSAGTYTITLDGNEDYRYVKLVKTGQVSSGYGEIKVFADVDVTQVSKKGNSTTANSWYLKDNASYPSDPYNPKNILDGNTGTFTMQNAQKYNYITVDLGESYPIGMIEMDKRSGGSDLYTYRKYIYGSNTLMSGDTANEDVAELSSYGYTKLATIQDEWQFATSADKSGYLHPDRQFRLDDSYPSYREMMADGGAYRYITLKSNYIYGFNELSEFRAYVVNPKVNGVKTSGNTVTITFSDEMIASLLNEENISLYCNGMEIPIYNLKVSDDMHKVSFDAKLGSNASYSVMVSKNVRNKQGVTMKENKKIDFIISE